VSDDPDYSEVVTWSYTELAHTAKTALPTRLVEVSNETADFLKVKFSKWLDGYDRLSTRNAHTLPKVPVTSHQCLMLI